MNQIPLFQADEPIRVPPVLPPLDEWIVVSYWPCGGQGWWTVKPYMNEKEARAAAGDRAERGHLDVRLYHLTDPAPTTGEARGGEVMRGTERTNELMSRLSGRLPSYAWNLIYEAVHELSDRPALRLVDAMIYMLAREEECDGKQ